MTREVNLMITSGIIQAVGSPSAFPNYYVLFWSLFNILVLIAVIAGIVWYLKKQSDYRRQVVSKLDHLIALLEPNNPDNK